MTATLWLSRWVIAIGRAAGNSSPEVVRFFAVFADVSNVKAMYAVDIDAIENVANTSGEYISAVYDE
jgi:hypothetical protein